MNVAEPGPAAPAPRPERPRVLLLEQYFYPEGWGGAEIPREIATHFAGLGWKVEVICGSEQYAEVPGSDVPDPRARGVIIRRVPRLPGGGEIRSRRTLRQIWFGAWACLWLFMRRPPDVFMAQTNPPGALPLVALAATLWRKPFVLVAMDLYPEVLLASGARPGRGLMGRWAGRVFGWAYRSATRIVSLGPAMSRRILAKGVPKDRLVEIENWATGDVTVLRGPGNRLRAELGLEGSLVLVYSGNLGLGHEFETLLEGFALALTEVPEAKLVFFGEGRRLPEVKEQTKGLGLESAVRFSPLVPAHRLPESLGLADLGIVTLREGFEGLMVPSKLLGYMARGIPILYVGPPGDVDPILTGERCGIHVSTGDAQGVARAVIRAYRDPDHLREMGVRAHRAYQSRFTRERALTRYEAQVRECLSAGRALRTP